MENHGVIDGNQPRQLADAFVNAYDERVELREKGKRGRQRVLGNYTWELQAEALVEYLQALCTPRD